MSNELVTLPPSVTSRGVSLAQWNTLCDSLFPGAKPDSILMAVDYCKARQLDIMKKPCHIVQIGVKNAEGRWENRDVILPGIYEYRTTAHRTQLYLGHSEPEYGPITECAGVMAPAWCKMTMYRWHEPSRSKIEFPVMTLFSEVVATKGDGTANARWERAPQQMLTKCCEAAGLREAFPDELGGTSTDDEMDGRVIDVTPRTPDEQVKRSKPMTQEPQAKKAEPEQASDAEFTDSEQKEPALVIKSQIALLENRIKKHGVQLNAVLAKFEIGALSELPFDRFAEAKEWVESHE